MSLFGSRFDLVVWVGAGAGQWADFGLLRAVVEAVLRVEAVVKVEAVLISLGKALKLCKLCISVLFI